MSDIYNPEEFENLYQSGGWDGNGSGPGSTELFTREFRKVFEKLLVDLKIKSVFDLGCGDWQWQRRMNWGSISTYLGWDVSDRAIADASRSRGPDIHFKKCDAFIEPIWPEADLLLVKDVVHHLSKFRVRQLIEKAKIYDYVLWVVDIESELDWIHRRAGACVPCNWPKGAKLYGDRVYDFDLSVEGYPYGQKLAILQFNP